MQDEDESSTSREVITGILKTEDSTRNPVPEPEPSKLSGKRFSRQNVAMNAIMNRAAAVLSPPSPTLAEQTQTSKQVAEYVLY